MAPLSSPARLKNVNNFCIDHLVSSLQFDVKGVTFFCCVWWERPWDFFFFFFFFCIFIREVVFLPTQSNSVARCWIVIVVGRCSGAPCTLYYIAFVAVVSPSFPSHRFTHTRKCHDVLPPVCITLKCGDIYLDVTSMHYVFWTHPTLPYTYYIYILYYIQLNRNSYV